MARIDEGPLHRAPFVVIVAAAEHSDLVNPDLVNSKVQGEQDRTAHSTVTSEYWQTGIRHFVRCTFGAVGETQGRHRLQVSFRVSCGP
jgi:hypothetical protein